MAKELATIIQQHKGDFSHYLENHARCFCHVLALILGAGLNNLKLKNPVLPPLSKPGYFPPLEIIEKLNEEMIEVNVQPLSTGNAIIEEIEEIE